MSDLTNRLKQIRYEASEDSVTDRDYLLDRLHEAVSQMSDDELYSLTIIAESRVRP